MHRSLMIEYFDAIDTIGKVNGQHTAFDMLLRDPNGFFFGNGSGCGVGSSVKVSRIGTGGNQRWAGGICRDQRCD